MAHDHRTIGDEALLVGLDENSLIEADRRFRGRIEAWARRRHRDPALADEIANRTVSRLWDRRDRYDPARGSASAWVFLLARTVAADVLRERRRHPTPVAELRPVASVEGEADRIVAEAVVSELLDRLSDDHRTVIRLAFIDGLTQAEIAANLDLPLGTVKTRMFYGLRSLRLLAEELGVTRP